MPSGATSGRRVIAKTDSASASGRIRPGTDFPPRSGQRSHDAGTAFDGPIIAAEVLFLLAYQVVCAIGFARLAQRILGAVVRPFRPARFARSRR